MNQELARIFPNRSLDAIKGVRRKESYRSAVLRFIAEEEQSSTLLDSAVQNTGQITPNTSILQQLPQPSAITSNADNDILQYIQALPPPRREGYGSQRLLSIIENAHNMGKATTAERLAAYLLDIFPQREFLPRNRRIATDVPRTRRKARRREYAVTQKNWNKHQNRCIRSILDGPSDGIMPARERLEPYWRQIMEECSSVTPPPMIIPQSSLNSIWSPIREEEIEKAKPTLRTSPGPDGISAREIRAIPIEILVRIFNLILWTGRIPEHLRTAKTIFIPKTSGVLEPENVRPITISSIVVRQLHGILASRIINNIDLDPRQRGFIPSDGCAENVILIDLLLRHTHESHSSCYIASLDVSKAFDSVSHSAIRETINSFGFPLEFKQYLEHVYNDSGTRLVGEGWVSNTIYPKRGVKQGDPLSPIIFNMVIDRLLRSLPSEIGCSLGTAKINALAFADDLILCASTPNGLSKLLEVTNSYLSLCGLKLNPAKCLTISIKGQPKNKRTLVEERTFQIENNKIPFLKRSDEWRYLGVTFTPSGKTKFLPHLEVEPQLERLARAPLKPQQRLHALRTVLIARLYYKLALGNIMIGSLNKTDRIIRASVRKWLNLPKDVPIAFFHAPVDQGGLGIPAMRWQGPLLRFSKINTICIPSVENVVQADTFIANERDKARSRLQSGTSFLTSVELINNYWSGRLHTSVDGAGLLEAKDVKQSHRWIKEPSKLLSGRDFLNCIKLRINALPVRSRTSRGRPAIDRRCRAGCQVPETLNHIVQQCFRTQSARIERHNSVVNFIARDLRNKGFNVKKEPHLATSVGLRKPDIVATKQHLALVIDAQVVTDGRPLIEAHRRKVAYYNTTEIKNIVQRQYAATNVDVLSVTLNWRGIWSGKSADQLIRHGIITTKETALISTRVAIGSVRSLRIFNAITSTAYRTGVG